jgi:hypothetical protein
MARANAAVITRVTNILEETARPQGATGLVSATWLCFTGAKECLPQTLGRARAFHTQQNPEAAQHLD